MSSIPTFQCPNCGSTVTTNGADKEVQCAYCGSTVIVPEELRNAPQPQPQPMQYSFGQPSQPTQPSEPVFQNMATVGKVAAGTAIGITAMSFILPIILTCVILAAVGGILFYVFSNVNSTIQQTTQAFSTAAAPANLVPTSAPAPTPTLVPTEAIPTPVPFSKVILKDDFTSTSSGWSRVKNQDYTLEYKNGNYHVYLSPTTTGHAVWVGSSYTDISVEVDAEETAGPSDGTIGVSCRATKNGQYTFEFDQNGDYGIYKYDASGNSTTLTSGTLNPNTVNQNDINHIEAVCMGDSLTMLLNNQVLAEAQDSDFTKGGAGMIVTSNSGADNGMDVLFSHFLVKGP
jgi:DNA-directed RNA polymerase subunit RPC12/RpoP